MLYIIRNKITLPDSSYFEQSWKRFLDDCSIFFLRLSLIKPNELLDVLNSINPAIQFTMERTDTQLPFIDIMINQEGKNIYICLFKINRLKKICLLKIKPPQALLEKHPIFSCTWNLHDY